MRMKHAVIAFASFGLAACGSVAGSTNSAGIETDPAMFMWGYTEAWNRHDAASVAANYYDMGRTVEEQTVALEDTFERMREAGYDKSTIHEIEACETEPGVAWAGMKFTRWKTDGTPLGPDRQASQYELKWEDARGWRIASMGGRDVEEPLECPSS